MSFVKKVLATNSKFETGQVYSTKKEHKNFSLTHTYTLVWREKGEAVLDDGTKEIRVKIEEENGSEVIHLKNHSLYPTDKQKL